MVGCGGPDIPSGGGYLQFCPTSPLAPRFLDKAAQAGNGDQRRCTNLDDVDFARCDQLIQLRPANACKLHRDRDTHGQRLQRQLRRFRHGGGFGQGAGHELRFRQMDFVRAILPETVGSLYRRLCAWLLLAAQRRQTGCRKERDRLGGLRRMFRFPAKLHHSRAFRAHRSLALLGGL